MSTPAMTATKITTPAITTTNITTSTATNVTSLPTFTNITNPAITTTNITTPATTTTNITTPTTIDTKMSTPATIDTKITTPAITTTNITTPTTTTTNNTTPTATNVTSSPTFTNITTPVITATNITYSKTPITTIHTTTSIETTPEITSTISSNTSSIGCDSSSTTNCGYLKTNPVSLDTHTTTSSIYFRDQRSRDDKTGGSGVEDAGVKVQSMPTNQTETASCADRVDEGNLNLQMDTMNGIPQNIVGSDVDLSTNCDSAAKDSQDYISANHDDTGGAIDSDDGESCECRPPLSFVPILTVREMRVTAVDTLLVKLKWTKSADKKHGRCLAKTF